MARGRKKKVVETQVKEIKKEEIVETTSDLQKLDSIVTEDQIDKTLSIREEVSKDQTIENVSVTDSNNESPVIEKIEPIVTEETKLPETNESVNNIEKITDKVEEKSNEEFLVIPDTVPEKIEVKLEERKDNNPVYPPSVNKIINRLRLNPSYKYLPMSSLIRIASSKMRSKYFFTTPVKKQGSISANFNIK